MNKFISQGELPKEPHEGKGMLIFKNTSLAMCQTGQTWCINETPLCFEHKIKMMFLIYAMYLFSALQVSQWTLCVKKQVHRVNHVVLK